MRRYRLFVPPGADRIGAVPLVVVLGGVGNNGDAMAQVTQFDRVARTAHFVVAYPDGLNGTWNAGYCCLGGRRTGPDDVAFLRRMMDDIEAGHNIDRGRVFVTGVSAGAMMAYRLGCEVADRVAAVGAVAGAMVLESCHPARPVSVIAIHGTADSLVPYEGGRTAGGATEPSPPAMGVVQRWAELNRCTEPAAPHSEGPVMTVLWDGCASATSVKLVTVEGGGHNWFASDFAPDISGAVDATSSIWSFFEDLQTRE